MTEAYAPIDPEEAFRAARRKGVGGSDAAPILGVDRFRSALQVWAEKLNLADKEPENQAMKMGKLLEPIVAGLYVERTKKRLAKPGFMHHPKYDWMMASIDRVVVNEPLTVEIKTSRRYDGWGPDGSDQVPEDYFCQVQHYLAVTGHPRADCAVLIAGSDFRVYPIEAHPEFIEMMIERERTFWHDHVLKGVPPAIEGSDACSRMISRLYKREEGGEMLADSRLVALAHELKAARANFEAASEEKLRAENEIKYLMGDKRVVIGDDFKIVWANVAGRTVIDWEKIAKEANIAPELIAAHTKRGDGYRRFSVDFEGAE